MATFNKFNIFTEDLAKGNHNLGSDQLKIALTNSAPSASNTVLTDITEISYTNLGSRNVTTSSCSQTAGVLKLVLADPTMTATGAVGPFRYVVLYNDTSTNDKLIGWYDRGSSDSLASGDSLVVDFDGSNGVFTIT